MADGTSEYDVAGAIASHLWHKDRLSNEINECALGQRPDGAAPIEMCDFGRWLRDIAPKGDDAAHHEICLRLHAEFHVEAEAALRGASDGRPDDAQAAVAPDGSLTAASKRLTAAMMTWWSFKVQ